VKIAQKIIQKIKKQISLLLPSSLNRSLLIRHQTQELMSIPLLECDAKNLRSINQISLKELFDSKEIETKWNESIKKIDSFAIPDGTGGVNPGDRKAIFYLISALKPASVLEIGTHIGASTSNIASALLMSRIAQGQSARLISVDITDVNCPQSGPWLKSGVRKPPIEMIKELGCEKFVEFFVDTSLSYFSKCQEKFDFIFLDGDHSAKTVYQEIPRALELLNPNGVILLHDYFPKIEPLWSDGSTFPGPFLATERLAAEGKNLVVLPLGALPWPTKLQSNVTSLALLLRKE
jgi:predicted O-methyltransferase YrrM